MNGLQNCGSNVTSDNQGETASSGKSNGWSSASLSWPGPSAKGLSGIDDPDIEQTARHYSTQTDRFALSYLRKQVSSSLPAEWIPAPRSESRTSFTGMTHCAILLSHRDLSSFFLENRSV